LTTRTRAVTTRTHHTGGARISDLLREMLWDVYKMEDEGCTVQLRFSSLNQVFRLADEDAKENRFSVTIEGHREEAI
jgi:hypothetical protein